MVHGDAHRLAGSGALLAGSSLSVSLHMRKLRPDGLASLAEFKLFAAAVITSFFGLAAVVWALLSPIPRL
jgi:hypothetical protein